MVYIVFGLILFILLLPSVIWRIYRRARWRENLRDAASKPYVCPNCGLRFYAPEGKSAFMGADKALLKCPQCQKISVCSRPYDLD